MQAKPDCCPAPDLEVVQQLWGPPGPERDIRLCRACGAYWRFDAHERMNFEGGEDHYWEWYTRLTPGEAAAEINQSGNSRERRDNGPQPSPRDRATRRLVLDIVLVLGCVVLLLGCPGLPLLASTLSPWLGLLTSAVLLCVWAKYGPFTVHYFGLLVLVVVFLVCLAKAVWTLFQ